MFRKHQAVRAYSKAYRKYYVFVLGLLSLLFVIYFLFIAVASDSVTNTVFVDGVNWLLLIESIVNGQESFFDIRSSVGGISFYLLIYYLFGLVGVIFINSWLIAYSFSKLSFDFVVMTLFLPFYFLCLLLPSKDVLSLYLTVPFLIFMVKKDYRLAVIVSLLTVIVRDAYGVLMLLLVGIYYLKLNNKATLILLLFICVFIDSYMKLIFESTGLFILERTLGYFMNNGLEYQSYFVRIFANVTNLGARYVLESESYSFSMTGFTFMLAGIGIFMAFIISIKNIFFIRKYEWGSPLNISAYLYLTSVILFSLSPLIQPRYLIPLSFIVLLTYRNVCSFKNYIFLVGVSFVVLSILRIAYVYTGVGLPHVTNYNKLLVMF